MFERNERQREIFLICFSRSHYTKCRPPEVRMRIEPTPSWPEVTWSTDWATMPPSISDVIFNTPSASHDIFNRIAQNYTNCFHLKKIQNKTKTKKRLQKPHIFLDHEVQIYSFSFFSFSSHPYIKVQKIVFSAKFPLRNMPEGCFPGKIVL